MDTPLKKQVIPLVVILLLGALVYAKTLAVPFMIDDSYLIEYNPVIKELNNFFEPASAAHFPEYSLTMRRAVTFFTFALNFSAHGLELKGYHLVNIAIHLVNGVLVFLLLLTLFRMPSLWQQLSSVTSCALLAPVVAYLFVLHPIQTEAVNYVTARSVLLTTLFFLTSVICYWHWRHKQVEGARGTLYGFLSVAAFILSLKSKENGATLIFILFLSELFFFTSPLKKKALVLSPFIAALIIFSPIRAGIASISFFDFLGMARPQVHANATFDQFYVGESMSSLHYFFTQIRVLVLYLKLLVLPVNQDIMHHITESRRFFEPAVLLCFGVLSSLFGVALWMWRRWLASRDVLLGLASFGILWFFLTIAMESTFIPNHLYAMEYRLYLPCVGLFLAVSALLLKGYGLLLQKGLQMPVLAGLGVVLVLLPFATFQRNTLWASEIGLAQKSARNYPENPRAHNWLGELYGKQGRGEEAIAHLQRSIQLNPGSVTPYTVLGDIYYKLYGNYGRAIEYWQKSIEVKPEHSKNYMRLYDIGLMYQKMGQSEKAESYYLQSIARNNYSEKAYANLGFIYKSWGRYEQAREYLLRANELMQRNFLVLRELGIACRYLGKTSEAVFYLQKAYELNSGDPLTRNHLQQLQQSGVSG